LALLRGLIRRRSAEGIWPFYADAFEWVEQAPEHNRHEPVCDGGCHPRPQPYVSAGLTLPHVGPCKSCIIRSVRKRADKPARSICCLHFLDRHPTRSPNNPRNGHMYRQRWDRMTPTNARPVFWAEGGLPCSPRSGRGRGGSSPSLLSASRASQGSAGI